MGKNPNIDILEHIVVRLGALADEVVFVGGCATGLLITDPGAPPIRITRDVDVIVELVTFADYHRFTDRLREKGFIEDVSDDAPLCRWQIEGVLLDVMPTDEKILGFSNRWYRPAIAHAIDITLPSMTNIKMVSAPYFLATKLEAFFGRGQGDYLASHDLEDFIAVVDGRDEIMNDVRKSEKQLQRYLSQEIMKMLENVKFRDALPGFLPTDTASQGRLDHVRARLQTIADLHA